MLETGAHTQAVVAAAQASSINLRRVDATHVAVSLDETVTVNDLGKLIQVFADALQAPWTASLLADAQLPGAYRIPDGLRRRTLITAHTVFSRITSETDIMQIVRTSCE